MDDLDDILGFESDDEDVAEESADSSSKFSPLLLNQAFNKIFIALMKLKPFMKSFPLEEFQYLETAENPREEATEVRLFRKVCFVCDEEQLKPVIQKELFPRLQSGKFQNPMLMLSQELPSIQDRVDVIVYFSSQSSVIEETIVLNKLNNFLNAGGTLIYLSYITELNLLFDSYEWVTEQQQLETVSLPKQTSSCQLLTIRKRSVLCNETGAIYWTKNTQRLENERKLLEKVSVPISSHERESGLFSEETHKKAVKSLLESGVVIFPGLFKKNYVKEWSEVATTDMKELLKVLKEKKNIDLFLREEQEQQDEPQGKEISSCCSSNTATNNNKQTAPKQMINNFHELSMREALRCDIRNTPAMKTMIANHCRLDRLWPLYHNLSRRSQSRAELTAEEQQFPYQEDLRFHPGILPVLHDCMHPPPRDNPAHAQGNWGRWNFEGLGPEGKLPLVVGKPGAIFSFPGCCDQTIHADTAQLFVHVNDLPPHYINLFIATQENSRTLVKDEEIMEAGGVQRKLRGFSIGMTAFVVGSHHLRQTAEIMTGERGQELLETNLIRPQLEAGDALLFDCRILHFGLANQPLEGQKVDESDDYGEESWRPLLYVNYHQDWFHDPKNWNDNEKLL
jgi:hypothetical protein